jgi:hypothetical protein
MLLTKKVAVASALISFVTVFGGPLAFPAQAAGCDVSDRIDGSTLDGARKRMEKAGYHKVKFLKKSCDNFWHAKAEKDGAPINIVLSPKGFVIAEGN